MDDQIVLRRGAFRTDPALAEDEREFVVLGLSNDQPSSVHTPHTRRSHAAHA
jgi:hypothetical protein